jgi:uncharacterized membrane protein
MFVAFPLPIEWLLFAFMLGGFEYLSGMALHKIMHLRLWNYTGETGSVKGGYTDLFHASVWGLLALVCVYLIHPLVLLLIQEISQLF